MPPRIRTRASKALKENIDVTGNKLKPVVNNTKAPRKVLADKTNSASDDASLEIPKKSKKTITSKAGPKQSVNIENVETKQNAKSKQKQNAKSKENSQPKKNAEPINDVRPRRDRRLPTRFVENPVLKNLSNSKDRLNVTHNNSETKPQAENTPAKNESLNKSNELQSSPFKTPAKVDSSLLASRPRRICRLPSRLEDHSISPNRYIPIQPANASTPIQKSKTKLSTPLNDKKNVQNKLSKDVEKKQVPIRPTRLAKIDALKNKVSSDNSSDKSSPDSNNNAKGRSTRRKPIKTQPSVTKKQSPVTKNQSPIRKFLTPINKNQSPVKKIQSSSKTQSPVKKISSEQSSNNKVQNLSFKLLGSKKKSQETDNNENLDVYEFTFDPDEEPKIQKKKRKRTVTKKPTTTKPKAKRAVYRSNYDQNISKALAALKNAVKPGNTVKGHKLTQIAENSDEGAENVKQNNVANNINTIQNSNVIKETNTALNDTGKNSVHECNYPSIRVEDIAADIEPSMDHHDDINYSPVNSPRPNGLMTPNASVNLRESIERPVHNNDPLNLQEELSFFDDQPVASSSMNMSVRHPLASPWRVEFGSLPIKWPVNTYIKPNMTPAVESSFINSEDTNKKKHVYTNMLPQTHDMFPEIPNDTPNLKQTSIIEFIREIAEKKAKKKRGRGLSPPKAIYEEIMDTKAQSTKNKKPTKKATDDKAATPNNNTSEEVSSSGNDTSHDKENSKEERKTKKRKNDENICDIPAKSPRQQEKDKDCTYFGFDESENLDSENVSPIKINNNPRSLRARSRPVLKEVNGPTRAALPTKTKIATSSDAVNKVYEELKSAADAPSFPDKVVDDNATNIEDPSSSDDSESVHLFEDIELHHTKPTRKSYGKAKKVTFRQRANSDSDTEVGIVTNQHESSEYDDLADLTFEMPNVKEKKTMKKKKSKNLRTKKEEQEAEAWAVGFNSMCEDIEDFPLIYD